jgi:hypothetical protein
MDQSFCDRKGPQQSQKIELSGRVVLSDAFKTISNHHRHTASTIRPFANAMFLHALILFVIG